MKIKPIFLAMAAWGVLSLLVPILSTGQTVSTAPDPKALATLLLEVQAQQKTMADNQTKIDEKLATIAESLRQARIYISRGR